MDLNLNHDLDLGLNLDLNLDLDLGLASAPELKADCLLKRCKKGLRQHLLHFFILLNSALRIWVLNWIWILAHNIG
jgi:hypothetical protein